MNFRNYLVATIFIILLICGPIDHSWPGWLAIRISYLILIPILFWLLLSWIWNSWQPSKKIETTLERILFGLICVALFTLAILEATSKTHIGNTLWVRTREGMELVGDEIVLEGPDYGTVIILITIALFVLWFGVVKKTPYSSES